MESGNGIEVELVKGSTENALEADGFGKENEMTSNGAKAVQVNEVSEDTTVKVETLDSSEVEDGNPAAAVDHQASNVSKKVGSGGSNRLKKAPKDQGGQIGAINESQKKRPVLSQSFSFPSKANSVRKSTTFTRQPKVASSSTNGDLSSKQSALATASSNRRSLPVKSGSVDVTVNDTSSEVQQLNDAKTKPSRHSLPVRIDDDAHSYASSTTPRGRKSTGSGFNFRLDERAEKRKEFFMKLEEKNNAKEAEKSNLQEKSKEHQEAEIKQLRKSLTFKATPMPSFYKEPGPPKVELKKIPPTRAKSPKLGRHKPSITAVQNLSEGNISGESARHAPSSTKLNESTSNDKVTSVASKNLKQRSLSKLPSQKSDTTKPEAKYVPKRRKSSDSKPEKAKVEGNGNEPTDLSPQPNSVVEPISIENRVEEAQTTSNVMELGIASQEVPVQG